MSQTQTPTAKRPKPRWRRRTAVRPVRNLAARPPLWRRILGDRVAMISGALVLVLVLVGLLAPWIAPYDPNTNDLANALAPPSAQHWLGTDNLGRDLLSRLIHGTRISLIVGVFAVGVALVIGVPLGLVAGYFGGLRDTIIMRGVDMLLAFPSLVLAILIVAAIGPSLYNAMFAVGLAAVPIFARLTRSTVLAIKEEEFVAAAEASGASHLRLMAKHILPQGISPLTVQATLEIGTAILMAASLSFLGLGAQPPTAEWGAMVAEGRNFLVAAPQLALFPGLAVTLCVLGFNTFGESLNDLLNPRLE